MNNHITSHAYSIRWRS